jgi:hypothetical protein
MDFKEIKIRDTLLKVYKDGTIERYWKNKDGIQYWSEVLRTEEEANDWYLSKKIELHTI